MKTNNKKKRLKKNKLNLWLVLFLVACIGLFIIASFNNHRNKVSQGLEKVSSNKHAMSVPIAPVRIPILLYHYVEYVTDKGDTIRKSLSIPPSVFENQITTLKDGGYTFMTASELADVLDGRSNPPVNPIIISFDDGYRDFYTDVFPILKELKVKAVAYIVWDFIDKPNFLLSSQIREIAKSGLVEIGAHTVNHRYLKGLSRQEASYEITKSKELLGAVLGVPIVSFAYPYGAYDNQAIEIVKQSGFKTAVTTMPGIEVSQDNRYKLYRIRPGQRIGNTLLTFLKQETFIEY